MGMSVLLSVCFACNVCFVRMRIQARPAKEVKFSKRMPTPVRRMSNSCKGKAQTNVRPQNPTRSNYACVHMI